ncbi:ESX secretion-associated protein EspG [Nocardia sp. NPDC127579]|uniref:ESX secretion-associated protein EspG n=1 Tax=Nocardia sp. NPDC127579 TaxID=3345402 RepID=UPI00363ABB17
MTRPDWLFTALAFKVLWRAMERDVLPYPLQFRSTADTVEDFEQAWKNQAVAVAAHFDESLYGALRVLAEPEARLEMAGEIDGQRLRVHAAVLHRHAVLLQQDSAGSPEHGGNVRMRMLAAEELPRRIAAMLPNIRPGQHPGFEHTRQDLEDADNRPRTSRLDDRVSPQHEAAAFFERPRSGVIQLAVYPGAAIDNRPAPSRGFHVMDYPDGRYLVRSGATVKVSPGDRMTVATDLDRVLKVTVGSYREQHGPSYR